MAESSVRGSGIDFKCSEINFKVLLRGGGSDTSGAEIGSDTSDALGRLLEDYSRHLRN